MKSILDYISEETNGNNYKSYKYCFENVEVPKLEYDDKQGIKVKKKLGNGYFGSSSATHIGQIVPLFSVLIVPAKRL